MTGPVDLRALLQRHGSDRDGLLRIDWPSLLPGLPDDTLLPDLSAAWVEAFAAHRPGQIRVTRSDRFVLVEVPPDDSTHRLLELAERHGEALERYLDGIAAADRPALPMLSFASLDDFVSYMALIDSYGTPADADELDTEPPAPRSSAGAFLVPAPIPHLVLPRTHNAEAAIVHEVSHSMVLHLPMPLWLDEGIAVSMESLVLHTSALPSTEEIAEHRSHWTPATIQAFWRGDAFRDPEAARLAYGLARILVGTLARDYERLVAFANAAHRDDGGMSACREVYGQELGKLPCSLLGPGKWGPDLASW